MMTDDMELVREFATRQSDAAFETLVSRHLNLVYSVALRQVRDPHLAQEVTQVVFIILARKAKTLGPKTILSGWLYRTAQYAGADALKSQRRRQHREQEAYMESILNCGGDASSQQTNEEAWTQIAPLLDAAMLRLGEKDRNAIVLRYFENKNLREVGAALGASEDSARVRINRALAKLRKFFTKRGVMLSATVIATAVSANSVQAAPVGLAATISAAAVKSSAVAASTLTLVKGALKLMAWTKIKTAVVSGVVVLLAASVAPHIWYYHLAPDSWRHRLDAIYRLKPGEVLRYVPPPFIPERMTYYQTEVQMQAKAIPAGPNVLLFIQDKQGNLKAEYSFGPKQFPLWLLLRSELGFAPYEFEGPQNLLNLTVNGDWTISQGISQDDLVKALEPILWKSTKHHIVFQKQTVERDVIIVTGNHFAVQPGTSIFTPKIQLYAENLHDNAYDGYGDLKTFFQDVGAKLEIRLIDETAIDPQSPGTETSHLTWTYHSDSDAIAMKNRRAELTDKLLKNLTDQTGLVFTREQRPVDVWFISEQR